jgi:hypothetical protein
MKKGSIFAVAVFVLASFAASDVASAQSGYGGGGSGSRARVEVCHNGQTIKVARSAVAAHINHGDTRGVCGAAPQVLGASTFTFNIDLRTGSGHSDVKELQKRLRTEGMFTFASDTGYFGPLTKQAVMAYQKAHPSIGFVTGFFGPLTRAEMNK